MTRIPCTLLLALVFAATPVRAVDLPDTGQDTCYNDTAADGAPAPSAVSIARDAGTHPRQDCRYGRDAATAAGMNTKTGAGVHGFDYTKIANNGTALPADATLGAGATDWACTRDNITGLTWELKSNIPGDLHNRWDYYTWYNSDGGTNGGNAGSLGNTCTIAGGRCNTEAFAAALNAVPLCTYTDWRLPTRRELRTLVNFDGSNPAIMQSYFPNTIAAYFWSSTSYGPNPAFAWGVPFDDGGTGIFSKNSVVPVRLVRGGQF